jgi:hypothetical protein
MYIVIKPNFRLGFFGFFKCGFLGWIRFFGFFLNPENPHFKLWLIRFLGGNNLADSNIKKINL